MRGIKFRGKHIDSGQWVYGNYVKYNEDDGELIHCIVSRERCMVSAELVYTQVDPETIGQFTGLKDKNGKDIYEGDIISFVDGQKRVNGEWVDIVHFYNVEYSKGAFRGVLGLAESMDAVEVIGNKWDNPELLKQ